MNCLICNSEFALTRFNPYQLYCSRKCNRKAYGDRNRKRLNRESLEKYHRKRSKLIFPTIQCAHCKSNFQLRKMDKRIRFCSKNCLKNNWAMNHPEITRLAIERWAKANPDRVRAIGRKNGAKRYKKFHEEIIHNAQLIQARRRGAIGTHTLEEWKMLKEKFNFSCACCGLREPKIKLTKDHIIPLSKNGTNSIKNLQPLCFSCNASKNTGLKCRRSH